MLFVDWDDARRADSYRITLVEAASTAEVAARLVEESEAFFTNLPAGITVWGGQIDFGEKPLEGVVLNVFEARLQRVEQLPFR